MGSPLSLVSILCGTLKNHRDIVNGRRVTRIIDLEYPDFSECCGYIQYLFGDGVLYIPLMILLTNWYAWANWLVHKLWPSMVIPETLSFKLGNVSDRTPWAVFVQLGWDKQHFESYSKCSIVLSKHIQYKNFPNDIYEKICQE